MPWSDWVLQFLDFPDVMQDSAGNCHPSIKEWVVVGRMCYTHRNFQAMLKETADVGVVITNCRRDFLEFLLIC